MGTAPLMAQPCRRRPRRLRPRGHHVRAIRELRAGAITTSRVYTPVPLDEIEEALTGDGPVSPVRLFTLVGGLTGTAPRLRLTIWSSLKWDLITGGKPVGLDPAVRDHRLRADDPLRRALHRCSGSSSLGRLPQLRPSPQLRSRASPRTASASRSPARPTRPAGAVEILRRAGAEEVRAMKWVFLLVPPGRGGPRRR